MSPKAARRAPVNRGRARRNGAEQRRRRAARRAAASPGMPVSAATVTGVVCEAAAFGSLPASPSRSAYARLKPPMPTPATGWWSAIRIPLPTSAARPLVALFQARRGCARERCRTCGVARPEREHERRRAQRRHARASARAAPAATAPGDQRREARLREREERPTHARRRGRAASATRRRPRQDDDEPGEDRDDEESPVDRRVVEDRVARKNGAYAFATITFGFQKTSRVGHW